MSTKYASLHTHTMYSLLDSINRPNAMMKRLAAIGQTHVAITDHGNAYAFSEVAKAGKEHGIHTIPGVEFYVAPLGMEDRSARNSYHLTVFALDKEGYANLCKLHTESFKRGFYYNPRIDLELLSEHSAGLVALSGCLGGALPKALRNEGHDVAVQRLRDLKSIFGERFWLEFQDHGIPEQREVNAVLQQFSSDFGVPCVATNDAHYTLQSDHVAHDIIICLGSGAKITDDPASRKKIYLPWGEHYLKSADEMLERFPAEYVAESARIAEMAEQIDLDSKTYHIPIFCERPDAEIRRRVYAGLSERYDMTASDRSDKMSRADYELEAICKAGFSSYMLIVADIYDFMRKEHIPYGAGRGSAAGSIVAYALGVTDVDPLRFGLLFERFINPERVSLPDIDMDISQERREEVIQYVKNRWGESNVAQIITFTTLGGRAAIRDVGRVLNIPLTETDRLAKMVPLNGSLTRDRESRHYLRDAIGTIKGLKDAYHNSPTAKALLDQAMELEGVVKAASLHAAGVVIADAPLESYVPVTVLKDTNKRERLATAYDMNQLEDQGLIKFDFLGLRNVDVVDKAIKDMKRDGAVPESFDKSQIPYDDDKTYRMLSRGLTAGVFQLESTGMRKWLRELKPSVVEDVMAMVALYRPGPMESIPSFVRRKHGEELIVYPHPLLEEPLRETYGVPVYQEQLMEIGRRIAGWTLARADQLRKVIGKKIVDKIEEEKEQFVEDAVKQGHERQWAEDLFTHFIEPAARYSFNKSHACAYGDLAYKTAWLKANFPTHYFAALMTSVAGDTEKLSDYVSDARALGIAILPPDVHESGHGFTPIPQKRAVRFGLSAIKNVGSQAVDLIIEQRAQGNFSDFFDFVSRTRNRLVTSRTIESLIYAGALDLLPGSRAEKLHSVSNATTRADELQEDLRRTHAGERAKKRRNPIPEAVFTGELPLVTDQDLLAKERELIGIYLSEHPFTKIAAEARAKSSCDLHALRELNHGMRAVVCGIVTKLREHQTKSKKQMLFATIEDDAVSLEVTVFPRQYDACASAFKLDRPVVLQGSLEITMSDNEIEGEEAVREVKFICDTARPFEHASLMKPIAIQPSTPAASSPLADNYAEPVIEQASRSDVFRNVTLTADNYREIIEQIGQDFHNYKSIDVRFVLPNNDEIFVTNKRASALAMPDAEPAFY